MIANFLANPCENMHKKKNGGSQDQEKARTGNCQWPAIQEISDVMDTRYGKKE